MDEIAERYSRQVRFAPIGAAGQRRLAVARGAVVGCGALGAAAAEQLARSGVGFLRLIDRDFVEPSNLGRQCLYTEADAAAVLPKAIAAAQRLADINSTITYEPVVAHVDVSNVATLLAGVDVVVDGSDNFAVRHLINEVCCRERRPWVFAACTGSYGCSLPVLPGEGACLRCLQDELPGAGETPTCDTAGVVAPIVHLVASWQVTEVLKLLIDDRAAVRRELWTCDVWQGTFQRLDAVRWRDPACVSCGSAPTYPALTDVADTSVALCGRDGVQVRLVAKPDLRRAARALADRVVVVNDHLLRWQADGLRATMFADGRVIVQGTADPARARAFCDRHLGG
ncbi:MAG: ThiF family adenylyltransferase [Planctomycetota bacterium]|jgi:adenylyltransferase/sulfurtransferase